MGNPEGDGGSVAEREIRRRGREIWKTKDWKRKSEKEKDGWKTETEGINDKTRGRGRKGETDDGENSGHIGREMDIIYTESLER